MDTLRQLLKTTPPFPLTPSKSTNPFRNPSPPKTPTATATPVTILELFQSQGCDSCPPANSYLISNYTSSSSTASYSSSSSSPATLLLTYEVTYWDRLGWPDTFGNTRWDARQRDYAAVLGQRSVYTPQVLIDGGSTPLSSWRDLPRALSTHHSSPSVKIPIKVSKTGQGWEVEVGKLNGGEGEAQVLAVWYEEQPDDVRILRGENRGVTLPHRNVVRDLVVLGGYKGEERFEVQERSGLRVVVLVQAGRGGRILGAVCLG